MRHKTVEQHHKLVVCAQQGHKLHVVSNKVKFAALAFDLALQCENVRPRFIAQADDPFALHPEHEIDLPPEHTAPGKRHQGAD